MQGSGERARGPVACVTVRLCSSGPGPQEKGSVPDWAIVLITVTVVAAIAFLLYGIKKVSAAVVPVQWGWDSGESRGSSEKGDTHREEQGEKGTPVLVAGRKH